MIFLLEFLPELTDITNYCRFSYISPNDLQLATIKFHEKSSFLGGNTRKMEEFVV